LSVDDFPFSASLAAGKDSFPSAFLALAFWSAFPLAVASALADVDGTAGGSATAGAVVGTVAGFGYPNRKDFAFDRNSNPLSFRSYSSPIKAVGENDRLMKYTRGCQYQNWQKTAKPTTAATLSCFVFESNLVVTFLPTALSIPEARIASILLMYPFCLSRIIFSNCCLQ
jgi:hypothetical protein